MPSLPITIREPQGKYQLTIELTPDDQNPLVLSIQPLLAAPEWARQIGPIFWDGTLDAILEKLFENAINASTDH